MDMHGVQGKGWIQLRVEEKSLYSFNCACEKEIWELSLVQPCSDYLWFKPLVYKQEKTNEITSQV